ncbi:hypothetical protein BD289DRAFT_58948 [Coniella lustricola]|uniref:Secreted protein n=1 Tax=Coniella lustricola TaxID=2025994 RepID=A0A2T3A0U6_9PEZI|nr:hypothetical protein BD289DRAFT_58948 [Coniella lustricola]
MMSLKPLLILSQTVCPWVTSLSCCPWTELSKGLRQPLAELSEPGAGHCYKCRLVVFWGAEWFIERNEHLCFEPSTRQYESRHTRHHWVALGVYDRLFDENPLAMCGWKSGQGRAAAAAASETMAGAQVSKTLWPSFFKVLRSRCWLREAFETLFMPTLANSELLVPTGSSIVRCRLSK